jgi:acyl carrier protein
VSAPDPGGTRAAPPDPAPAAVLAAVQRIVVTESRLSVDPQTIGTDEPLNGRLLRVTSLGLLGMLISLEDDLGVLLPDDLFTGRRIRTVGDLAAVVASACPAPPEPAP